LLDQTFSLEMGCSSLFRNGQLFALVILACCFSLLLQARFVPGLVFRDSSSLFVRLCYLFKRFRVKGQLSFVFSDSLC